MYGKFFLPALGFRTATSVDSQASSGWYWSSSSGVGDHIGVYLRFTSSGSVVHPGIGDKIYGGTIRCVRHEINVWKTFSCLLPATVKAGLARSAARTPPVGTGHLRTPTAPIAGFCGSVVVLAP